jgi:hypothetical protein
VRAASLLRSPRALRALGLALGLLLGLGAARAFARGQDSDLDLNDDALWTRLRRLESAFRQGDATALRQASPGTGKVRIDLPPWTEGPASFGPGQIQGVFAQVFSERRTHAFSFLKEDVSVSPEGTAFARARWVWCAGPGDQRVSETLVFSLRSEDGDWRLQEIRRAR